LRLRVAVVQAVDQAPGLVQFPPQGAGQRLPAGVSTGASAPIALLGGFQLAGEICHVSIQFTQQCLRLCAPRVFDHARILSPFSNVRMSGVAIAQFR
jgi:hypothetical protein